VSGVGHGFGRCIAETFTLLGARVFGCDLSAAELAENAKAGVNTQLLDLTDRAAAAAWIAQIEQTTGGAVDVLVNNAGGVRNRRCIRSRRCRTPIGTVFSRSTSVPLLR
jgi:3-oxoacyl-[acyl-carrier protein] reductase